MDAARRDPSPPAGRTGREARAPGLPPGQWRHGLSYVAYLGAIRGARSSRGGYKSSAVRVLALKWQGGRINKVDQLD